MSKRDKRAGALLEPGSSKDPRAKRSDQDLKTSQQLFKWSTELIDSGGKWALCASVFRNHWCKRILPKLVEYERKTWATIANDSSGKSRGTRNHHIAVSKLSKEARKRLKKIEMNDLDQLYSFRLGGKKRLFGVVHDDVFKLVWYDPEHEVCPSKRK